MLPEHVVVVSVYLEQLLVCLNIASGWEDPLKMAQPSQLLLRLEKHLPVFGTQNLQTVIVVQIFKVVDILRVIFLLLVAVAEQPFLLLSLQLL